MKCTTLDKIEEGGSVSFKPKKQFDSLDEAIDVAKIENSKPERITKVVAYKCDVCFKYHIGRNGKTISSKDKSKFQKEIALDKSHKEYMAKNPNLKKVGWIDLSSIKY